MALSESKDQTPIGFYFRESLSYCVAQVKKDVACITCQSMVTLASDNIDKDEDELMSLFKAECPTIADSPRWCVVVGLFA